MLPRAWVPRQHSFAWPGPSPNTYLGRIYQVSTESVDEVYHMSYLVTSLYILVTVNLPICIFEVFSRFNWLWLWL